jgi:hypothetical protein
MAFRAMFKTLYCEFENATWQSRKRKITTASIFSHLVSASVDDRGLRHVMNRDDACYSHQALSKARMKMPAGFFKHLNRKMQTQRSPGTRVVAIDGSKVHVHPSYGSEGYKSTSCRDYTRRLMLLSSALDVHTRTCYDVQISKKFDERACATSHMDSLSRGDTMIFDRGYFSFAMLKAANDKGLRAVFRVRINACRSIKYFYQQPITYRRVMLIDNGTLTPMWLFKYLLDGVKYVCATNFDASVKEVQCLYKLRWRVESSFKRLKGVLNLEKSHSRTPTGFIQEVEARILFDTVCVQHCDQPATGYLVSVDACNAVCKAMLICAETRLSVASFTKILALNHPGIYRKHVRKYGRHTSELKECRDHRCRSN